MHILFLGPPCESIENALLKAGHTLFRTEEVFTLPLLEEHNFDFGISYRFKHIIRKPEIDWFNGKLINLHISYLPWNRGADPNLWSWIDNTPKGVTIHRIDARCDTGDILLQEKVNFITKNETLLSSYKKLSLAIEKLFINNIDALLSERIKPKSQQGVGSFHYEKDKIPLLYLIEEKWWDTEVVNLGTEQNRTEPQKAKKRN